MEKVRNEKTLRMEETSRTSQIRYAHDNSRQDEGDESVDEVEILGVEEIFAFIAAISVGIVGKGKFLHECTRKRVHLLTTNHNAAREERVRVVKRRQWHENDYEQSCHLSQLSRLHCH